MASPEQNDDGWVDRALRSLEGEPSVPDAARARARLRDRQQAAARVRRRRAWTLSAATCALVVVAALPAPRAAAQRLFTRLTLGRVAVVERPRIDPSHDIVAMLVMQPQPWNEERLRDLDEAQREAGFPLLLPSPDVVSGQPAFSVVKSASLNTAPFKVAEVAGALAAAGIDDVTVPKSWEGAVMEAEAGPVAVADYGDITIMQLPPFQMTSPAHVPSGEFMELVFRVFGRSESEARRLSQRFVENPAIVMHFPAASAVRDVPIAMGSAVLVGNPDGNDGMCFFWSTPERIFIIEADHLSEERAVSVANSMVRR